MKTIKPLSAILVLLYSSACTQPVDEYISNSSAFLCQESFYLGEKIDLEENSERYEYESDNRTGVVDCYEIGNFHLGTGESSQIIMIDRLVFRLNEEGRIIQLAGRWREINNNGRESLQNIRNDEYNIDWGDSEKYLELAEHKLNDLDKILYEIEREFGPSTSIRPVTWATENGSFDFSVSDGEYETTYLLSVQSN